MSDLRDLYQEVIVDHSRRPHNFCKLANANHKAEGFNPLCGDRLTLYLQMEGDLIIDASFEGAGCAISTASASLMTDQLKGKTKAIALDLFEDYHHLLTKESGTGLEEARVGKLAVLAGVREFPSRVKCATLAWHTLKAAFLDKDGMVSTEDLHLT